MNYTQSKPIALLMLFTTIALTIMIFILCPTWYWFAATFLAYMASFSHLCSLMLTGMSLRACAKLHKFAVVCGWLALAATLLAIVMMFVG